ncbi:hypothetical protein [Proteus mirabilis]|uniref:hypothetical protein n=1 Tax=Proteus mirabilis TaxID=584 RepID=UPI0034D73849
MINFIKKLFGSKTVETKIAIAKLEGILSTIDKRIKEIREVLIKSEDNRKKIAVRLSSSMKEMEECDYSNIKRIKNGEKLSPSEISLAVSKQKRVDFFSRHDKLLATRIESMHTSIVSLGDQRENVLVHLDMLKLNLEETVLVSDIEKFSKSIDKFSFENNDDLVSIPELNVSRVESASYLNKITDRASKTAFIDLTDNSI